MHGWVPEIPKNLNKGISLEIFSWTKSHDYAVYSLLRMRNNFTEQFSQIGRSGSIAFV